MGPRGNCPVEPRTTTLGNSQNPRRGTCLTSSLFSPSGEQGPFKVGRSSRRGVSIQISRPPFASLTLSFLNPLIFVFFLNTHMIPRRCHHRSAVALTHLVKPSQLPSHQPLRLSVAKQAIHLHPVTPRHFAATTPNKMSSATTFYDFKPLDSKSCPHLPPSLFTHHHHPY